MRSALESEEGRFTISKSCLIELAMHRKVERLPDGGKGRVEKAIVKNPDLVGMMDRGDIVVDKLCGVDTEAFGYRPSIYLCLLRHIFESYQLNGSFIRRKRGWGGELLLWSDDSLVAYEGNAKRNQGFQGIA